MSQSFSRFICWKPERIGAVINKEALSVDRADFLATHVPMRQIVFERTPRAVASASEEDLLRELHYQADNDQHTFVVIKGVPGTGKSHLIRWLKERYAAERPQEAVLLIERANTSLRGTLQQIINSGLFDRAGLPESLQRLQEAVTELSADALADNLLDQIKTATREMSYDGLPNRLKPERVYQFLLDIVIRERLKAPEGPIKRITAFLTQGREDNAGTDESPGFEPDDFVFGPDILRKIQGYAEAKKVADDLQYKQDLRGTLADYLNFLLRRYAISRATRLSAQDLREMFNELRQHLKRLGRHLALFIEDITAFTGIDEGLFDVLITQHSGEQNRAFCRLTSVVGVTDAYFTDYMPDNFKQRATHQLTLSSNVTRGGSDLMQDGAVRAEFAARYLNAMRMDRTKLEQWARSGASAASIPVACDQCAFRAECHAAFGYVEIGDESERLQIGTYPFNRTALDTLYRGLKDSYPRTPRTYLFDLLGYVLQSHSSKIETGDFPPPETELTPAVQPPAFNPPTHRQIVEKQGGAAMSRLMTLLLFWGDRTAVRDGQLLATLPKAVFRAFNVKMIEGAVGEAVATVAPEAPVVTADDDRYTRLIDNWMTSGRLSNYDKFAEWMADLVRSFVDWQAHGISLEQVKEYITQGRFEIEGQTGVSQRKHRLFFARSSELRYVFQALVDLNTNRQRLSPAQFGEHLATLSNWVRAEEPRIVAFVREPSGLTPPSDYLLKLLVRNVVLLGCLAGELSPTDDPIVQYHQVIASCVRNRDWQEIAGKAKDTHPPAWRTLIREVNKQNAVSQCRKSLLQLINRPQGRSDTVRYVDSAALITLLQQFAAQDWALEETEYAPDTNDPTWVAAMDVYAALRKSFASAVDVCYSELEMLHNKVKSALGEDSPQEMLMAMQAALEGLRTAGVPYKALLDEPFYKEDNSARWTAEDFENLVSRTAIALQEDTLRLKALYVGGDFVDDYRTLRERVEIIEIFEQELRQKGLILSKKITELAGKAEVPQSFQNALGHYEKLISALESAVGEADD